MFLGNKQIIKVLAKVKISENNTPTKITKKTKVLPTAETPRKQDSIII